MSSIIKISILASARDAIKGFKDTSDAADKMGGKVASSTGKLVGVAAGAIGVGTVVEAFKVGADEASKFQDVANQTTAALKTNASLHGLTAEQVQKSSAALETLTGAKIDENDATLAQDKLIRAGVTTQSGLQAALKASADVALGTGKDIGAVSTAVSKALADPTKAQGVLAKAGVVLSQSQADGIKAMVDSGNAAGAQSAVIAALETKYKGASEAAGKGFSADLGRAKDALADSERDIVTGILPTLSKLASTFAKDLPGAIATVKPIVSGLWTVLSNPVFLTAAGIVLGIVAAMKLWAIGVKAVAFAQEAWAAGTKIVAAAQWLLDAALDANPIGLIVIAVAALVAGIVWLATKTQFFQTIWHGLQDAFSATVGWIGKEWSKLTGDFSAGVDVIVGFFTGLPGKLLDLGKNIMRGLADGIQAGLKWVEDKVKGLGGLVPDWLKSVLGIASPSKVMHGLGQSIMQGLANGMDAQIPALKRTLAGVTDAITGVSAAPTVTLGAVAVAPGSGGAGRVYQINVSVPPTVDLPEVGRQVVKAVDAYERQTGRKRLVTA